MGQSSKVRVYWFVKQSVRLVKKTMLPTYTQDGREKKTSNEKAVSTR